MAQTAALLYSTGNAIDYTPGSAVAAGDVVVIGSHPLVATVAIEANVKGTLACKGVFKVPQKAEVITAGDAVYWDADGDPVTGSNGTGAASAIASAGYLMGWAVETTANTDTYVKVDLRGITSVATIGGAVTATDIEAEDASLGINGLDAAQGGAIAIAGGTSSTAANAGGAVTITGGVAGAEGAGGAVTITAAAGGSTSGNAGVASMVGGAGNGTTNGAGGISKIVGGAGKGNAAGGAGQVTGGAGGATGAGGAVNLTGGAGGATSGTGGAVTIAGGAGSAGNANGGAVTITGGAKNGSGANGAVGIGSDKATAVTIGYASGTLTLVGIPTADPHVANQVWANSAVLTLSAG